MIRPVILCGGAGTRLWPVSRARFPKQLLRLTGEQSLLQQTATRLKGQDFAPPIVVSAEEQGLFIKKQLDDVGSAPAAIILEPKARNTSAAAALAAAWLQSNGHDDLILVMPSDHVILDIQAFLRAIAIGARRAEAGTIVTFGAEPTEPNTQYGYIEADLAQHSNDGAFPILRFVEKPDRTTASHFLAMGGFYWNAGIFLMKAGTLLEEMRKFLPESLDAITASLENATSEGAFVRPHADAFDRAANISIDHALMEKTSRGMVVPVRMGWSDVGGWDAVWKLGDKNAGGNVTQGDVVAVNSKSSLVRAEAGAPLVAAVGCEGMAIIATSDAVLVAPLSRVSEVKDVVQILSSRNRECVTSLPIISPSDGPRDSLLNVGRFEMNEIIVEVGESTSLATFGDCCPRHLLVLRGSAEIAVDEQKTVVVENQAVIIDGGAKIEVINLGPSSLEVLEIIHSDLRQSDRKTS